MWPLSSRWGKFFNIDPVRCNHNRCYGQFSSELARLQVTLQVETTVRQPEKKWWGWYLSIKKKLDMFYERMRFLKVPQSAENFLFLQASFQILWCCNDHFLTSCSKRGESAALKLSIYDNKIEKDQIDTSKRKHTLLFGEPGKAHFYIALKFQIFLETICSWLGAFHDCYILRRAFIDQTFENFTSMQILDIIDKW